jgi:N-acetylglutamate synthase-like GNAT family acetyltransferase
MRVKRYEECEEEIREECCKNMLREWGGINGVKDMKEQDEFIKKVWKNDEIFYVMTDETFIGCMGIDKKNPVAMLTHLYITDENRKKGYASHLLKIGEEYIRKKKWNVLFLACEEKLYRFYKKRGYEQTGQQDGKYIMMKKIG